MKTKYLDSLSDRKYQQFNALVTLAPVTKYFNDLGLFSEYTVTSLMRSHLADRLPAPAIQLYAHGKWPLGLHRD